MTKSDPYRYVLVGCGGQKRDCRNTLAYNLYTSAWFRWNRACALWTGDFYSVLSARGVIPWIAYVEPYDLRITNSGFKGETEPNHDSVAEWADHVADHCDETIHYHTDEDAIEIVILSGRNYTDPLRDRLDDVAADYEAVDVSIRYPFDDTSGNGQQMRWAREQVAAERGVDPDDLELNAQFCDSCERAARDAKVYPPGKVTSPPNGMAPEWWTADGAWLCENCRQLEKGEVEGMQVEKPDLGESDAKPDEVQTTFESIAARTDGGEQDV
jgi:hypothetical protein